MIGRERELEEARVRILQRLDEPQSHQRTPGSEQVKGLRRAGALPNQQPQPGSPKSSPTLCAAPRMATFGSHTMRFQGLSQW
jgi:hypothetical protein